MKKSIPEIIAEISSVCRIRLNQCISCGKWRCFQKARRSLYTFKPSAREYDLMCKHCGKYQRKEVSNNTPNTKGDLKK